MLPRFFLTRHIKYKPRLRASIVAMNDDYMFLYSANNSWGKWLHAYTSPETISNTLELASNDTTGDTLFLN